MTVIDYLALPFTTSAEDVITVRNRLGVHGKDVKILAKIDTLDGITNF